MYSRVDNVVKYNILCRFCQRLERFCRCDAVSKVSESLSHPLSKSGKCVIWELRYNVIYFLEDCVLSIPAVVFHSVFHPASTFQSSLRTGTDCRDCRVRAKQDWVLFVSGRVFVEKTYPIRIYRQQPLHLEPVNELHHSTISVFEYNSAVPTTNLT